MDALRDKLSAVSRRKGRRGSVHRVLPTVGRRPPSIGDDDEIRSTSSEGGNTGAMPAPQAPDVGMKGLLYQSRRRDKSIGGSSKGNPCEGKHLLLFSDNKLVQYCHAIDAQ